MITLLEKGKDPWMMKRKMARGHCPGEHEDVGHCGCCWPSSFPQTHNLTSRHCGLVSMDFAVFMLLSALQHSHTPLQTSYLSLHPSFAFQSDGLIFSNICMYVFVCVHMCFFRGTHLCVCLYVGQRSSSVTLSFFFNNFVYVGVLSVYMSAYCTHACLLPAKRTLALLELELQL